MGSVKLSNPSHLKSLVDSAREQTLKFVELQVNHAVLTGDFAALKQLAEQNRGKNHKNASGAKDYSAKLIVARGFERLAAQTRDTSVKEKSLARAAKIYEAAGVQRPKSAPALSQKSTSVSTDKFSSSTSQPMTRKLGAESALSHSKSTGALGNRSGPGVSLTSRQEATFAKSARTLGQVSRAADSAEAKGNKKLAAARVGYKQASRELEQAQQLISDTLDEMSPVTESEIDAELARLGIRPPSSASNASTGSMTSSGSVTNAQLRRDAAASDRDFAKNEKLIKAAEDLLNDRGVKAEAWVGGTDQEFETWLSAAETSGSRVDAALEAFSSMYDVRTSADDVDKLIREMENEIGRSRR